jgi:hypothetical protein
MFRSRFFAKWVALALVGLFAVACDMRGFRVQLNAFEDDQVRGLWLWKETAAGDFERYANIAFGALHAHEGEEFLPYSFDLNGDPVMVNAPVDRDEADNLTVTLYFSHEPGAYKLTSYNSAGESGFSAGTLNY